jgi:prepilin-type N-terminal cleavage/methylation domain-containing protein
MKIFKKICHGKNGFGLIEVVIGVAIISISLFAIMSSARGAVDLNRRAISEIKGKLILEEGSEVVRFMRDSAWSNVGSLSTTTTYYLATTTTGWVATTTQSKIDGLFLRRIVVSDVFRGTGDKISESGAYDSGTKKFTITVLYEGRFGTTTKQTIFYLSDIFDN